jgi:putative ABC transport system permease protein
MTAMTRPQLVVKNLFRNRRRTFLTVASVAASIFLLAVFCATYRYINAPPTPGGFSLLLMVTHRTSTIIPLPLSYGDRIRNLPGVAAMSPVNMVDGFYGGQDFPLWALAFDAAALGKIFPDWQLPPDQRQAFVSEKTAFLAGLRIAQKYGWKLGDHVTLHSPGYNLSLDLVLRGIYSSGEDETLLGFHWDYLNDAQGHPNKPGGFWVRAQSAEDVPRLMQEIDTQFRNAEMETRTQPMKQWVLDLLNMLGNVKLILVSISAAVVFAVLLIVANTMGMSIRERTAELAVLRALGFQTRQVLGLLAAESLGIALLGAIAGCLMAWTALRLTAGYQVGGAMPVYIQVDAATVGVALGVAIGISLGSTLIPAYRASRANIAQALRFVG